MDRKNEIIAWLEGEGKLACRSTLKAYKSAKKVFENYEAEYIEARDELEECLIFNFFGTLPVERRKARTRFNEAKKWLYFAKEELKLAKKQYVLAQQKLELVQRYYKFLYARNG